MKSKSGIVDDHPTLQAFPQCKTLEALRRIHAQMITTGLILHTYPLTRLLLLSSALASLSYTLTIFNQAQSPTVFVFNTLISAIVNRNAPAHTRIALSLYTRILASTALKPNNYTYPSLFKACGSRPWFPHGRALHAHLFKFLHPLPDHFVQASLLNFYSKYGKLGVCRYLFHQITNPDLASWNSILSAYARNDGDDDASDETDLSLEVLCLFTDMQKSLIRPNEITLVALITACAGLGALNQGVYAHVYALKSNLKLNCFLRTALMGMYANCGCLSLARQLFDEMPDKDTFSYNAMIGGFAIHGQGHEALNLFRRMILDGFKPDEVTIVVVMSACSHVGLVDEGCKYFNSMEEYGLKPKLEHYGCLVDLLGRAGRVEEAEEWVKNMHMVPNAILWRALLGAARVHEYLRIGEVALTHLIQLEPETSGNYVLLSNMYASTNRWEDAKTVRKLMKDSGIKKNPGSSIVEINGTMHEFVIGDKSHPDSKEIYAALEELNKRVQIYSGNR